MRIDSHHHFWQYSPEQYAWIGPDMQVLQRDYLPIDLEQELHRAGIDGVVTVQARQTLEETEWLLQLADQHEFIRGVVGWLPLAHPEVQHEIEKWSHYPKLRSVRHVVQDEPNDAFILGDDFNRGVALLKQYNLVYDILVFARHLAATIQFVDQHPQQPFVLDHIAKPTISESKFDQSWANNFRELAKRPHVVCKFSALITEVRDDQWTVDTLRPYWEVALEAFGAKRLMFGSDWPVCLLRSDYSRWYAAVDQLSSELSAAERQSLWGQTAISAYRLATN